MPLRPLPYHEVRRRLLAAGFIEASQKGSHVKYFRQRGQTFHTAIVQQHREIAVGTLRSILRQAGLTPDQFESL